MHHQRFPIPHVVVRLMAAALMVAAVLSAASPAQAGLFSLNGIKAFTMFSDLRVAQLADAACSGDPGLVASLARSGADVNGRGKQGITPLIWAMTCHNTVGMTALLQAGANPNLPMAARHINTLGVRSWVIAKLATCPSTFEPDLLCQPPVYLAAGGKYPQILSVLLDHGGDANVRDQNGDTALMNAVSMDRVENMKILLAHGADVNAENGRSSVLWSAANRFDMVLYMVQHAHFTQAILQSYADLQLSRSKRGTYGYGSAPSAKDIQEAPYKRFYPQVLAYFKSRGIVPYYPLLKNAPPPPDLAQLDKDAAIESREDAAFKKEHHCIHGVSRDSFGHLYCSKHGSY